eukprot:3624602-Alexandrium_andersonii.AAC.1
MYGQHSRENLPAAHFVGGEVPGLANVFTDGSVCPPNQPVRAVAGGAALFVGGRGERVSLQEQFRDFVHCEDEPEG